MGPKQNKTNPSRASGKLAQQLSLRSALRMRVAVSILVVLTIGLVVLFNLTDTRKIIGAVSGDYRSKASGNWNSVATWQKYNGTTWVNAVATPTSADGAITIQSGHTVTVTANVTVDQVVVNSGGTLVVNALQTLTEANGTGTDLQVDGTMTINATGILSQSASSTTVVNGTMVAANTSTHTLSALSATTTINTGGRYRDDGGTITTAAGHWIVNSGGIYQHNRNGSSLPIATWNSGSTCEITGITLTVPGNLNQAFQNFTWNCTSQSANISLGGTPSTINGNLTIASTSTYEVALTTSGTTTVVGGNYIQSGGTFTLSSTANVATTLNITGDYTQSGGTFSVVKGNGCTGTVNITGNWSRTGGTITVGGNGATTAQFVFNNAGSQVFTTSGATTTGNVDFTVNSGSTLVMANNILTGRNFTLSAGGAISLGSSAGITSSGATGNIQVTGTRSFNTAADYIYNGASAQNTGSGLPGSVNNLTINNSSDVTLTSTTGVSNTLILNNGQLLTGANEIKITSTLPASILGYSSASYIVGNLRRSVAGTGTYDFPLGTSANYELATLALSGATGFSDIVGSFTNANPIAAGYPLTNVLLSNLLIDKMLTYGYWTLTPNSAMSGGTYAVTLNETGNPVATGPSYSYCVLKRNNVTSSWQSTGTHVLGSASGSTLSAGRSGLTVFSDFAIGYGQYLGFKNDTLISGVDGQVGAVYKFPDVCYNIDCWIEIKALSGGAVLSNVDNFVAGNGYDEAWQPYIDQAANTTSSILWKLTFKSAGTANDTTIPFLAITGIDVDGGAGLKEFVEATMPQSYALYTPTTLTVTNNGGNYRATSSNSTINNIDTGAYQAMYQINYQNLNNFLYRTGAINTGALAQRQHSLYFKSFFSGQLGLPMKLVSFKAQLNRENKVDLTWATSSEINNDHFTIERSADGEHFETILTRPGAGTSTDLRTYAATDEKPVQGYSYYRLKQTDIDGNACYSETQTVNNKYNSDAEPSFRITSITPNPFSERFNVSFMMTSAADVNLQLINSSGQVVFTDVIHAGDGLNQYDFTDKTGLPKGIYFLNLLYEDRKQFQKILKN